MLIPLPLGSLRIACGAAKATALAKFEEDKGRFAEAAYQQLHDGAVHNGLTPSASDLQQMRDMTARDVEHAMENHHSTNIVKHIENMLAMADYVDQSDSYAEVIVDHLEFQLLKDHLPLEAKKD